MRTSSQDLPSLVLLEQGQAGGHAELGVPPAHRESRLSFFKQNSLSFGLERILESHCN